MVLNINIRFFSYCSLVLMESTLSKPLLRSGISYFLERSFETNEGFAIKKIAPNKLKLYTLYKKYTQTKAIVTQQEAMEMLTFPD